MSERKDGHDAVRLDPNMRLSPGTPAEELVWRSPREEPFRISGFAWFHADGKYRRLPVAPSHPIRPEVDALANCTAGGQIRFRTDSTCLALRVELSAPAGMYHMPATGQCGFDCYIGEPGSQRYAATTRYDHKEKAYECVLLRFPKREMRTVTLNFPLYQGVEQVEIGLDPDARVAAPPPYRSDKRVILYGTSITQGGCASRPGMAYPNILSRRIPLEFINLGFSGNGRGEPEMARIIGEIPNPALLVLDYEANVGTPERMRETLPAFIRIYREAHPDVPILVLSRIRYARDDWEEETRMKREENLRIQRETVERFRRDGDGRVYFHDGSDLLGEADFFECTVDGVHPTDLGFMRMADRLKPILERLLAETLSV